MQDYFRLLMLAVLLAACEPSDREVSADPDHAPNVVAAPESAPPSPAAPQSTSSRPGAAEFMTVLFHEFDVDMNRASSAFTSDDMDRVNCSLRPGDSEMRCASTMHTDSPMICRAYPITLLSVLLNEMEAQGRSHGPPVPIRYHITCSARTVEMYADLTSLPLRVSILEQDKDTNSTTYEKEFVSR
jgi:hypothetical protein